MVQRPQPATTVTPMYIDFDAVAHEVTIDFEDGRSPVSYVAARLVVVHHGNRGILCAELGQADAAQVGFVLLPEGGDGRVQILPAGNDLWRISIGAADS